jgi:hypothetical protein
MITSVSSNNARLSTNVEPSRGTNSAYLCKQKQLYHLAKKNTSPILLNLPCFVDVCYTLSKPSMQKPEKKPGPGILLVIDNRVEQTIVSLLISAEKVFPY